MKSDIQIREDVLEEIRWDPQLTKIAPRIGVAVADEVVTLTGVVDYYYQRVAAEKAAQRIAGVKVVAVDIDVNGAETSESLTDSSIAAAIRNALSWHSGVNEDLVDIRVDNGWVYLEGEVEWDFERKAAERAIENLKGVRGIINKIRIKGNAIDARDVKKLINAAFHRNAAINAANISVKVHGREVELEGRVRSYAEKKRAEEVALSMPGVGGVTSKLVIDAEIFAE